MSSAPSELDGLRLSRPPKPAWLQRLWREWCFARVVWAAFKVRLGLIVLILLLGAVLFRVLEPEKQHTYARGLYYTWSLVFGEPPEEFPANPILQLLFFLMPVLGLLVILEGIVEFALILRDRQRNEHSWCKIMAAALKDHVVLIGLGKLGYRSYRWLRTLGAPCVVIESNSENQFLEELRPRWRSATHWRRPARPYPD
jgi:voltage-gated potassium channel